MNNFLEGFIYLVNWYVNILEKNKFVLEKSLFIIGFVWDINMVIFVKVVMLLCENILFKRKYY